MLLIVKNKQNVIWIKPNGAIDTTDFSASLSALGAVKTVTGLPPEGRCFIFSPEECVGSGIFYGTLEIKDADGKVYRTYMPGFKMITEAEAYQAAKNQTINLSLSQQFRGTGGGGGGGGGDYPTRAEVQEMIDEAISDIGQTIIQTEEVPVVMPDGSTGTITLAQVAQMGVDAESIYMKGYVVDEDSDPAPDDGTLYLSNVKIHT